MAALVSETFFLPASGGQRLSILDRPSDGASIRGTVLFVHPWAEELNKSRRAVALGSRALAREGWVVLRIDLFGCGDSSGDFGEATWDGWISDIALAVRWLNDRFERGPRLWGLRAGCLLIADYLRKFESDHGLLLWQPVVSGHQHLTQFLRLKVANEMLGNAAQRSGTQDLRARIANGERVEVAGYRLTEPLIAGIEHAELVVPKDIGPIYWLEVSSAPEPRLSPASEIRIGSLAQDGAAIEPAAVFGQAFWQTVEIADCPALIEKTVEVMSR